MMKLAVNVVVRQVVDMMVVQAVCRTMRQGECRML